MLENIDNLIEAIVFASGNGITKQKILENLNNETNRRELNEVCVRLKEKYSGNSGIIFLEVNDTLQFASSEKYGEIVSNILQKEQEKNISQTVMEILSIIAYRQPITRAEIEKNRQGKSADYAISTLLNNNLIYVIDKKDGRANLYATTEDFLKKFDLECLAALPNNEQIQKEIESLYDEQLNTANLYKEVKLLDPDVNVTTLSPQEMRVLREKLIAERNEELNSFKERLENVQESINEVINKKEERDRLEEETKLREEENFENGSFNMMDDQYKENNF